LSVPCCEICSPTPLDKINTGKRLATTKAPSIPAKGVCQDSVVEVLEPWRDHIQATHQRYFCCTGFAILSDLLVERIASAGPNHNQAYLKRVMGPWGLWDIHGDDLFDNVSQLDIPPREARPKTDPSP
ncbi:hypothetical protein BOTBODRAFT_49776, partial [Botryobasidium botryosum FD-172 SS1]